MIELAASPSSIFPMALYYDRAHTSGAREAQRFVLPVGLLLCGATSVGSDFVEWPLDFCVATNGGLSDSLFKIKPPSARSALQEIKSTTGLTWQQLSRVFKVNPRSLHLWMDGETLDSVHEERLFRLLAIVRELPFSTPFQNRTFLLAPQAKGLIPLDLLIEGEDESFVALANEGPSLTTESAKPTAERKPLPPNILLEALQDKIHVDLPGGRSVKAARRRIEGE